MLRGQLFRNTLYFVEHTTRLDLRYPVLNVTLTFTLPNFQGLSVIGLSGKTESKSFRHA